MLLASSRPQLEQPKLLGIPVINDSTGSSQHNAIVALLRKWGVLDKVIGLVFDTTASNTGRLRGCATSMETTLKKSVLWLACRHHMYEIHIKHVSDALNGKRNCPSETLFVKIPKRSTKGQTSTKT